MPEGMFSGVFAPVVTVFDSHEEIRWDAVAENIRQYNRTALRGYMPLGSNGEFQSLEDSEALKLLELVVENRAPGKIVVGGCGRESVCKTVSFIKKAASSGLDYAFILAPFYFARQQSEEGLLRFFLSVADGSPIPIVIYNAPKFAAGITLSPEFIRKAAAHPNIVALKNSSSVPNIEYVKAVEGMDFRLIAGNIRSFCSGLTDGAEGGVLSTASYLPEYCCELFRLFSAGDTERAERLSAALKAVSEAGAGPLGVAGVKCAMSIRGLEGGGLRLPLMPLSNEKRDKMRLALESFDIPPFPISEEALKQWIDRL